MRSRSALARAALAAALLLAAAGCGHRPVAFPSHPQRLATDDLTSTDVLLALGYRPVAAAGLTDTAWAPALAPFLGGAQNLGPRAGGSANLDAIAGATPDSIVGPASLKAGGWGGQLAESAPTFYYDLTPSPPVGPGGEVESTWKARLASVAAPLGLAAKTKAIVARLGARAAAIRGQVAGKTVGLVRVLSPQTFSSVNDYDPAATVYEQDLGLKNFHLRGPQYGYRCAARPSPPRACETNSLYAGIASSMTTAAAILVESAAGPAATAAFTRGGYFAGLPAVRAGHVATAPTFEELGPLGVAFEYSALERAFGIEELHAHLADGHDLVLTLDLASERLCWSPAGKGLSLSVTASPAVQMEKSGCTRGAGRFAVTGPAGRIALVNGPLPVGNPAGR